MAWFMWFSRLRRNRGIGSILKEGGSEKEEPPQKQSTQNTVRPAKITDWTFIISGIHQVIKYFDAP